MQDSETLYQVRDWGHPYFSVNEKGHVEVTPDPSSPNAINLYELVLDMRARGIELPLLVRFSDILAHRIRRIHEAFGRAMKEYEYSNTLNQARKTIAKKKTYCDCIRDEVRWRCTTRTSAAIARAARCASFTATSRRTTS